MKSTYFLLKFLMASLSLSIALTSTANALVVLTVRSYGVSGVPIDGVPDLYGGTTEYVVNGIPEGTVIRLDAPLTWGGMNFRGWGAGNCTSRSGPRYNQCTVTMDSDLEVQANYYPPDPSDHFVTTWRTDYPGVSNSTSITVPMVGGPYDVDWNNDGTFDEFGLSGAVTHDFGTIGTYTIRIQGTFDSIRFDFAGDRRKIQSVDQWGINPWTTMERAFAGASFVTFPESGAAPYLSLVSNMYAMFANASFANPNTSFWDTSSVTTMQSMFSNAVSAKPDTSGWDTSSVVWMSQMFQNATSANPDTSGWDTSSVRNMDSMFEGATSADPDTSGWDTSSVITMTSMFEGATSADPDTSGWNVTSLINADRMFEGVTLSTGNYENLLVNWAAQQLQPNVTFSGGNSTYCSDAAIAARASIIATHSWTITDGGICTFSYSIGGSVSGLEGSGLVLQNNNGDDLEIVADGNFTFSTELNDGTGYSVTVKTQPVNPLQNCSVTNGNGTLAGADITDILVTCEIATCKVNLVPGGVPEYSDAVHEACEILVVGPDFMAAEPSNISVNSGVEIDFMPGLTVEQGATLNANVCGQSLCMTSESPMPYGCHSCVNAICDVDFWCCDNSFDELCLAQVGSVCNLVCE